LLPEVRIALHKVINSELGNPESLDELGKSAKSILDISRLSVANLIHTDANKLIFTSSGSESNAIAIYSGIKNSHRKEIVCSHIEHSSIHKTLELLSLEGYLIKMINTLPSGIIDISHASTLINTNTALVIVQIVNNETGVIQPIKELISISKKVGAKILCDGAQAVGKIQLKVEELECDYITFTAHKFHGPKGIGALWSREGIEMIYPLIPGGSQEFGHRGGTHNLIGIVGMGTAAELRSNNLIKSINHTKDLRDNFEKLLKIEIPTIKINGNNANRVSNTSNIQFIETDGKALFIQLLQHLIICSQTSACTAQYPEPSKTLRAMGLTYEEAFNSIRFSFSETNTLEEVASAVKIIATTYYKIKNKLGLGW
jgi:cysteine desulfurase